MGLPHPSSDFVQYINSVPLQFPSRIFFQITPAHAIAQMMGLFKIVNTASRSLGIGLTMLYFSNEPSTMAFTQLALAPLLLFILILISAYFNQFSIFNVMGKESS